ncbi:Gfo/Idh/MocA family protein [Candidatus Latescibacterota bacterium]
MPYRVGVIGCGRMAGTIDDEIPYTHPDFLLPYGHANGYAAVPETKLVAAADIDAEKRDTWCERFGVTSRYDDYRDMIRAEELDIVSITTHANVRAAPLVFAAEAGVRGIYAEKALCVTATELDAIRGACQRCETHLVYGAMRRYWAGFEQAREFVDSGVLGERRAVLLGATGGAAFHTHSHFIDAAEYLLGDPEPVAVRAVLRGRDGKPLRVSEDSTGGLSIDVDPGIDFAVVDFDNDTRLTCTNLPYSEVEVVCEKGALRSWGDSSGYSARLQEDRYEWRDVPFPPWEARSGTVAIIQDLVATIESGRPGRSSLDTARRGMEILFGMVVSHHRGGVRVELPLHRRRVQVLSR